jgi:hypothetical protein
LQKYASAFINVTNRTSAHTCTVKVMKPSNEGLDNQSSRFSGTGALPSTQCESLGCRLRRGNLDADHKLGVTMPFTQPRNLTFQT